MAANAHRTWTAATMICLVLLSASAMAHNGHDSCWHGLAPATGSNPLSCKHYDYVKPGLTSCIYRTVESVVAKALHEDPTNAGPLLRLHFHDCFVNGCDASVLLDASYGQPKGDAEKDAPPNLTLDGFDIINQVKAAVDATCSPDVSCADILAIVAATVVHKTGGPRYDVPLGRLDGCTSQKSAAPHYLPSAQATVRGTYNGAPHSLKSAFAVQGLDLDDLVALSGAHTIGQAHCANFKDRLCYAGQSSPVPIDKGLQAKLQNCCLHNKPGTCAGNMTSPNPDDTPQMDLERGTPKQAMTYPPVGGGLLFDNAYFKNIQARMALLTSDQALAYDPATARLVDRFAADQSAFFDAFVKAMVRMGNIIPSNMGVAAGAGMRPCAACGCGEQDGKGDQYATTAAGSKDAYYEGKVSKGYAPTCSSKAMPNKPEAPVSCLAYQTNLYSNRRGKCTVASPACAATY